MKQKKPVTIDTMIQVLDGQPFCECGNYSNSFYFDCVDCENVFRIINEFIRTDEFKEWLKRRYNDGQ